MLPVALAENFITGGFSRSIVNFEAGAKHHLRVSSQQSPLQ